MPKWIFTLALAVIVLGLLSPWLFRAWRPGRLPGDITVRYKGQPYYFPFTSTLLFSLLITLVAKFF